MNIKKLMADAIEANFSREKKRKTENFRRLNSSCIPGQILFAGSSLMEHFPVCELYYDYFREQGKDPDVLVYNRAIGGFTTDEFIDNLDVMLLDLNPSVLFINIGTNDITDDDDWMDNLISNYKHILEVIAAELPDTEVYMLAYYPVNEQVISALDDPALSDKFSPRTNRKIKAANDALSLLASKFGFVFIDLNEPLTDDDGNLKAEYTVDGVHIYSNAYKRIFEDLKPYIFR